MKRIWLESGDQKYWRTGRSRSFVRGLAASGLSTGATQMLSTPSRGAVQLSHLPLGEIWPFALTGLPNSFARSISGTEWMSAAIAGCAARIVDAASARLKKLRILAPLDTSVLGQHNSNRRQS